MPHNINIRLSNEQGGLQQKPLDEDLKQVTQETLKLDESKVNDIYFLDRLKVVDNVSENTFRAVNADDVSQFMDSSTSQISNHDNTVIPRINVLSVSGAESSGAERVSMRSNRNSERLNNRMSNIEDMDQLITRFEALEMQMQETLKNFNNTRDEAQLQMESQKAVASLQALLRTSAGRQALAQFGYTLPRDSHTEVLYSMAVENQGNRPVSGEVDLDIVRSAAGNAQLGSIEADGVGISMPELLMKDLANKKNAMQTHKSAKRLLNGFAVKDKELTSIEKLIFKMHDIDAKRYKVVDTVLKGVVLTGFGVAGIMAILAATGIVAAAAATAAASLIGIPAGIMLGAGLGWFAYKSVRNTMQEKSKVKWLEIARHEGRYYNKLKTNGMSDEEVDIKAQHKLASVHPKFATLVLWNKIKEAVRADTEFEESNIYKYLGIYGFKKEEMLALASVNNPNEASDRISEKLALPKIKEEGPVFG